MSPTSIRRTGLSPNPGLSTTDLDQKKDQARNRVKNIAVGVIVGLSLATAAYLGHGYFFGKTQPDFASQQCEWDFIMTSQQDQMVCNDASHTSWYTEPTKTPVGSPEFTKAHSDYLNSEDFKKCISGESGDIGKNANRFKTNFCASEAFKSHWLCV